MWVALLHSIHCEGGVLVLVLLRSLLLNWGRMQTGARRLRQGRKDIGVLSDKTWQVPFLVDFVVGYCFPSRLSHYLSSPSSLSLSFFLPAPAPVSSFLSKGSWEGTRRSFWMMKRRRKLVQVQEGETDKDKDEDESEQSSIPLSLTHRRDPHRLATLFIDVSDHAVKNSLALCNLIRRWRW